MIGYDFDEPDLDEMSADDDDELLPVVDWAEVWDRPTPDALVDRLLVPGRWTSLIAPAKAGKSTFVLHLVVSLARGLDPLTGRPVDPVTVYYLDKEMGEIDVKERLKALDLKPADLGRFMYVDTNIPNGDNVQGGTAIVSHARRRAAEVVVLDGVNEFFEGDENDNEPWRRLFKHTIQPLKRSGMVVLTTHNLGNDDKKDSRGSKVQVDKPDAVMVLARTDDGVKLTCKAARTEALLRGEMHLVARGLDGSEPIVFRESTGSWPAGTAAAVKLLDRLAVPSDASRSVARAALKAAGHGMATEVLAAAVRARKHNVPMNGRTA